MTTEIDNQAATESPENQSPQPVGSERVQEVASEAAKYRRRAQAAETERDALRARLEQTHRSQAEHVAASLERPADLWEVLNMNLADYQTDTGDLDEQKLIAALETAKIERPYLFKRTPHVDLGQGQRERLQAPATWAQALNPR